MKIRYLIAALVGLAGAACGGEPTSGSGGASGSSTSAAMPPTCDERHSDCDGDPVNGCETRLSDDAANCGACGIVCDGAHASMACDLYVCIVDQCAPGYEDRNADPVDGCEVPLSD